MMLVQPDDAVTMISRVNNRFTQKVKAVHEDSPFTGTRPCHPIVVLGLQLPSESDSQVQRASLTGQERAVELK